MINENKFKWLQSETNKNIYHLWDKNNISPVATLLHFLFDNDSWWELEFDILEGFRINCYDDKEALERATKIIFRHCNEMINSYSNIIDNLPYE